MSEKNKKKPTVEELAKMLGIDPNAPLPDLSDPEVAGKMERDFGEFMIKQEQEARAAWAKQAKKCRCGHCSLHNLIA